MQLSYERCARCGRLIDGDAFFLESAGGALCTDCREPSAQPYPAVLRQFFSSALAFRWDSEALITITRKELLAAESIVIGYLQRLLGHPLRSLAFIQAL